MRAGFLLAAISAAVAVSGCTSYSARSLEAVHRAPMAETTLAEDRLVVSGPLGPEAVVAEPTASGTSAAETTGRTMPPAEADIEPVDLRAGAAVPQDGDRYGPEAGESQLSLGGFFTNTETDIEFGPITQSSTTQNIALQAQLGYFVNEWLELGGSAFGFWQLPDMGSDFVSLTLEGIVNANLKASNRVWIYFGPNIGVAISDVNNESNTDASFGGHAGVRLWATPTTAFFGEGRYTYSESELAGLDTTNQTTQVILGLTFVF